jgi:hypothetical protein
MQGNWRQQHLSDIVMGSSRGCSMAERLDRLPPAMTAAAILKTRTLTNLYNERPAWLDDALRYRSGSRMVGIRRPAQQSSNPG